MTEGFDPTFKFYVGQDVVCVRADYGAMQKTTITPELVVGKVYKIRWLGVYNHYLDGEYLGIKVEGIERGQDPEWGYHDMPFYATRFRPVITDPLAVFRRIATDPDYKIEAPEGPMRDKPVREGAPRKREEV